MDLLTPEPGLVIWSGLTFLAVLALLTKFAWRPLLDMLHSREQEIADSLKVAEEARAGFAQMEQERAQLAATNREDREKILREAREKVEALLDEARKKAQAETDKMLADARAQIEQEKTAALDDLRRQVASLSVDIAGRLIGDSLEQGDKQQQLVAKYLKESNFN